MATKESLAELTQMQSFDCRRAYYLGYDQAEREMVIAVIFWGIIACVLGFIIGYGVGIK